MIHFLGLVRKGAGRGRALGFPTANISAPSHCEDGVYVARVFFNDSDFSALCFVGVVEMFGETERRAELYILDWEGDLYDKEIQVTLLKKIRESKKFDSSAELILAMEEDLRIAREYFKIFEEVRPRQGGVEPPNRLHVYGNHTGNRMYFKNREDEDVSFFDNREAEGVEG